MVIQRLDLSDAETAEELWALQHAAYRHEANLIGVADLPPLQDTVKTLQSCGETFYGYYADDGTLAGAVSTEHEPEGNLVICRMMVHPDHFRQGIGQSLVGHVLSVAPSGTEVSVTAEVRNMPAIRLYERCGFQAAGTLDPAPGITMIRYLTKIP